MMKSGITGGVADRFEFNVLGFRLIAASIFAIFNAIFLSSGCVATDPEWAFTRAEQDIRFLSPTGDWSSSGIVPINGLSDSLHIYGRLLERSASNDSCKYTYRLILVIEANRRRSTDADLRIFPNQIRVSMFGRDFQLDPDQSSKSGYKLGDFRTPTSVAFETDCCYALCDSSSRADRESARLAISLIDAVELAGRVVDCGRLQARLPSDDRMQKR